MQTEMASAAGQIFRQLNNADLKFGQIKTERGEHIELSHSSFAALLQSPVRSVRKAAFHQYYQGSSPRMKIHWPRRWPARSTATFIMPRPAVTRARWIAPCSPTTCRAKSTKTCSPRSTAICRRQQAATSNCGGGNARCEAQTDPSNYDTYVPILSELEEAAHTGNRRSKRGRSSRWNRLREQITVQARGSKGLE